MRRSIFFKVFVAFLMVIAILALSFLFFSYREIRNFYLDHQAQNLHKIGKTLESKVTTYLDDGRTGDLDVFVKRLGQEINVRITVVDGGGAVLADSDEDPESMVNHRFRPEIATAFNGEIGRSLRFSNTVKEDMIYVGLPIKKEGEIPYVLRLSLYIKDVNVLLHSLRLDIGRIVILVLILSLVGAYVFSKSITKPIKEMQEASRRIAGGDFGTKISIKKTDELRSLADSFNYMSDRVKNLFMELNAQTEKMNSILSSIEEGIVSLDREGAVIFGNESFKKIVGLESVDGKFYWEVVRNPAFQELVNSALRQRKKQFEEISIGNRSFLCNVNLLGIKDDLIVTLYDTTKTKDVEQIKQDFISNASHELRTPLTSIKGYVETLEEECSKNSKEFLEIIKRNTDRLIKITDDLLYLSELEEKKTSAVFEEMSLVDLFKNVIRLFEKQAKDKGIKLEMKAEESLPKIRGDRFRLEQMFINILDNAVKYTERGRVDISLHKKNDCVNVMIQDTGIGIPEEHLSRIFERFYVVDKSRSRKLGGTGLGLSIVKHIVQLHKGEVRVKSDPGEGTVLTITLPTTQ